jgi:hypothetical protein
LTVGQLERSDWSSSPVISLEPAAEVDVDPAKDDIVSSRTQ